MINLGQRDEPYQSCSRLYLPVRAHDLISLLWDGRSAKNFEVLEETLPDSYRFRIEYTKLVVQSVISLTLVFASIYIFLSPAFGSSDKHWASGTVGPQERIADTDANPGEIARAARSNAVIQTPFGS